MRPQVDSASFRDPSGQVFIHGDRVLRSVSPSYRRHFEAFEASPVSTLLRDRGWLVDYRETSPVQPNAFKTLESDRLPFISYPYEWSFSQLQDAALLTLEIQRSLLEHGFVLKDATPFNVQFLGTKPVFIDLLSFETLDEGAPWVAYRQFCESFLAPLLLMAHVDLRLGSLLQTHLDGVPLDLCVKLLPLRKRLRPLTLLHLVLHARLSKVGSSTKTADPRRPVSSHALASIARQLASLVRGLSPRRGDSLWPSYYRSHLNYTEAGFLQKKEVLRQVIERVRPDCVWDLGCNVGAFSEICSEAGARVVAIDSDPGCIEQFYRLRRKQDDRRILPLVIDLAHPSPGVGWANRERPAWLDRGSADLTLALGLVHHLRFTHNVPLSLQAELLSRCGRWLLLEFIPSGDEMALRLAARKPELLVDYTEENLLESFAGLCTLEERYELPGSERTLLLLRAISSDV